MADDGAVPAIPLKRSERDPDQIRTALTSWLAPVLGSGRDLSLSPLESPGGGVANETFLFDATWTAGGRERTEGFVVRVATDTPLFVESDVEVHARCYQALADVADVPVPRVYGIERDPGVLGAPFFVMERVEGDVPRDFPSWQQEGFIAEADPARRQAMWESAVATMAALHRVDVARFPFLAPPPGVSGLAHDLAYWRRYLDHGEAGVPHDTLELGYEWLRSHLPEPQPTSFAWGDARFCNLIFRDDRVVAVLDWDQVSLAGPESDLAWWRIIDPSAHAPLDGMGDGDALLRRWEEHAGRPVRDMEWHDLYAQFRMGVVMLNLFRNMAAAGQLDAESAWRLGREDNGPAKIVAERLRALGAR